MADVTGDPVYRNPFRRAQVKGERVDMGADFQGRAGDPVYALGPGVIVAAGHQWAGAVGAPVPGTWIAERLEGGPLAGQVLYTAEDINPAVHTGQRVTTDTVLGRFTGAGQLETGLANPPGTSGETLAMARGHAATGGDPGAHPTPEGNEVAGLLTALGAPPNPGESGGGGALTGGGGGCAPAAGMLVLFAGGLGAAVLELGHAAGLW